jgi:hypothetical protein
MDEVTWTELRTEEPGWVEVRIRLPEFALDNPLLDSGTALLRQCGRLDAPVSDRLLGLETVVRRYEQWTSNEVASRSGEHGSGPHHPV